jgi:hypothetical protein
MEQSQMNEREQIVYLRTALKNLALSAERYLEDGSWDDHVRLDAKFARDVLKATTPQKEAK